MGTVLTFILAIIIAPVILVWYFLVMIGLMLGVVSLVDKYVAKVSDKLNDDEQEGDF